jgi:putative transposase
VKVGQSTRIRRNIEMFSCNSQYDWLMKTLSNSFKFDQSDPAKFRLHVLEHYYKYGWKSACNAFRVGKSTLYDWKRAYEASGKSLISLIPKKTKPKNVRSMRIDYRFIEFIKEFREQYGNIDRRKIKVFLDEYANELGISSISDRTIGKIISRKQLYYDQPKRNKRKTRFSKGRTNKSPKATKPGYIEIDSVIVYINYQRHNFICCLDIFTKFAHVRKASSLSSKQAKITLQEFQNKYRLPIQTVQTDNGSEFLGNFHQYLEEQQIKHQFIYPRAPKINGVVERFNRTIQEEFINRNDEIYFDLTAFQVKLNEYLNWYNNKRPHMALKYQSPSQFLQTYFPKCG